MAKVDDLNDIGSLANTASAKAALNQNFDRIEEAFDNTLSRDGSTPNQMEADIDLNSNDLLNVKSIDSSEYLLNGVPFEQSVAYSNKDYELFDGTGAQVDFPLLRNPGSLGNLEVSIAGVMQRPGIDFNFLGTTLTFTVAPPPGTDNILVRYDFALPVGVGDADSILYTPPSTGLSTSVKLFLDSLWEASLTTGAALIRFLQIGVGAVARTLMDKAQESFSVLDFGAPRDGTTNAAPAINAALAAAAAAGVGVVEIKRFTYMLDGPILMQPGITLKGDGRAILTQRNGGNLPALVSFGSSAHGAKLDNLIIDGNRDNNADNINVVTVSVGTSDDVVIRNCTIRESNGYLIHTNSRRMTVENNILTSCYAQAIGLYNTTGALLSTNAHHLIKNNRISLPSKGAILMGGADFTKVLDNDISGMCLGRPGARMMVNINNNALTWVSGPDFSTVKSGMVLVINGGMEFEVVTVNSATSITLAGSALVIANTQATIGTGDMIGLGGSSFCAIRGNTILECATFGMGMVIGGNTSNTTDNVMEGNHIILAGKHAISLAYDLGLGVLANNSILNNKIYFAGVAGGIGAGDRVAISIASGSAGKNDGAFIDGNSLITSAGDGQGTFWLGTDSMGSIGGVSVGRNSVSGFANAGISGAVSNIALGAGWGTTATVGAIVSNGYNIKFEITAGGVGFASNALVTISSFVTTPEQLPIVTAKATSTAGTLAPFIGDHTSTRGTWVGAYTAVPVAGIYACTFQG